MSTVVTQITEYVIEIQSSGATGPQGAAGVGVPTGGTTGQVLAKNSNTDYDTEWVDQTGGGVSDHGALTGLSDDDHTQYHTDARGDARYEAKNANIQSHISSTSNPHSVTKSQVGLSNVVDADTTTTANITDSTNKRFITDAQQTVLGNTSGVNTGDQDLTAINAHISSTSNPHSVTATQVGLGNVDNTSDANKPISSATQTALDGKVDENAAITGATKTKITYDDKGLVTSGADATTADIADSSNKRYVTDAQLVVIGNTSGTNTGDQTNVSGYAEALKSATTTVVVSAATAPTSGQVLTASSGTAASWVTPSSGGVSALTAIGASPNANAATISGSNLNLQPASASFGGVVTTADQTFAGRKTFNGYVTIAAGTASVGTAPLKLTPGTNLTTAEAGAFEYNGTSLTFTRSGTLRAGVLLTDTASPNNTYSADSKGTSFSSGSENVLIGRLAGGSLLAGSQNVIIGHQAANFSNSGLSNAVVIGYFAGQSASGPATAAIFIGSQAGQNASSASNIVCIGQLAGFNASGSTGSCFIGNSAGNGVTAANAHFIGQNAGNASTGATDTIGIGQNAGRNASGAAEAVFLGKNAGYNSGTAMTGDFNIGIGTSAGAAITTGQRNILLGRTTGDAVTTGSDNLAIGNGVDLQSNTADGQMTIQNAIFGTGNSGTGTTASTGNIGMYVPAPTARLHLPAGAAAANSSPLKLTSGTNLTTAENGAFEYNGADLFFTKSGATRGTVVVGTAVTTEAVASDTTVTVTINGTTYKLLARA